MSDKGPKEHNNKTCGVVMPISALDGCLEAHWTEVLSILREAITDAGFDANMVSNADDSGIIQKRIIQNLYDNPIVVCDVSGKNPNVMFELGLRLAFDKPTIIVKDDKTTYSFDTSNIEHLEYPRDLRFGKIVEFKKKLAEKIIATYKKATSDPTYTTFLKHFGEFTVAKIDKKEVSTQEYILEELKSLQTAIQRLSQNTSRLGSGSGWRRPIDTGLFDNEPPSLELCLHPTSDMQAGVDSVLRAGGNVSRVREIIRKGHKHIQVWCRDETQIPSILSRIANENPRFVKCQDEKSISTASGA